MCLLSYLPPPPAPDAPLTHAVHGRLRYAAWHARYVCVPQLFRAYLRLAPLGDKDTVAAVVKEIKQELDVQ